MKPEIKRDGGFLPEAFMVGLANGLVYLAAFAILIAFLLALAWNVFEATLGVF